MKHEKQVRELLCEVLENPDCQTVAVNADLAPLGMDSLNCVNLVIALEDVLSIDIPMEKLGMRFVGTVFDICQLIEEVV